MLHNPLAQPGPSRIKQIRVVLLGSPVDAAIPTKAVVHLMPPPLRKVHRAEPRRLSIPVLALLAQTSHWTSVAADLPEAQVLSWRSKALGDAWLLSDRPTRLGQ